MACRSAKRAEAARNKLFRLLDAYIQKLRRQPGYEGHADEFQKKLQVDIIGLDLAMLSSVFKFAAEVSRRYVSRFHCP